jgi:hypothetical protein
LTGRVDKPVLVGGGGETARMAEATDTGAGDAVPTVLDRFLAAGISREEFDGHLAGGLRSPDSASPMRPLPHLRRSLLRSCSIPDGESRLPWPTRDDDVRSAACARCADQGQHRPGPARAVLSFAPRHAHRHEALAGVSNSCPTTCSRARQFMRTPTQTGRTMPT